MTAKSVAQYAESQRRESEEVEPGTILVVNGRPYIYLTEGKRPYFKDNDLIVVM